VTDRLLYLSSFFAILASKASRRAEAQTGQNANKSAHCSEKGTGHTLMLHPTHQAVLIGL
jgi:hypothetical protein